MLPPKLTGKQNLIRQSLLAWTGLQRVIFAFSINNSFKSTEDVTLNSSNDILLENIGQIRKRQPIVTWLLSFILVGLGYYLSDIQFLGLEWLTRSGCLIVLLGVWLSIGSIIEERLLLSKLNVQQRIILSRTRMKLRKINAPQEYIDKEINAMDEEFDDKIEEIRDNVRYQLGVLEVSLLMTGTFLWGFGDLLLLVI